MEEQHSELESQITPILADVGRPPSIRAPSLNERLFHEKLNRLFIKPVPNDDSTIQQIDVEEKGNVSVPSL